MLILEAVSRDLFPYQKYNPMRNLWHLMICSEQGTIKLKLNKQKDQSLFQTMYLITFFLSLLIYTSPISFSIFIKKKGGIKQN
jgi:hypothetical protein